MVHASPPKLPSMSPPNHSTIKRAYVAKQNTSRFKGVIGAVPVSAVTGTSNAEVLQNLRVLKLDLKIILREAHLEEVSRPASSLLAVISYDMTHTSLKGNYCKQW